jgi:hypothetical protein
MATLHNNHRNPEPHQPTQRQLHIGEERAKRERFRDFLCELEKAGASFYSTDANGKDVHERIQDLTIAELEPLYQMTVKEIQRELAKTQTEESQDDDA